MDQPPDHEPQPKRRFPLVLAGGVAALLAGGAIAWGLLATDRGPAEPPPASEAGLIVESGEADAGRIDPAVPLRCFVQGQFVGELTLADCARRNGVATDALDVGIDQTGALAAAEVAGQVLTPLPPEDVEAPIGTPESALPPEDTEQAGTTPTAGCWRHGGGRWRRLPGEMDLNACVQTLFSGRCERPGGATYGRFGQQTLRLVTGRVEISDDNQSFRTLLSQGPNCHLPPVG